MFIKKTTATVASVVLLAIGYIAGTYLPIPFVEREKMEGSIGKAKAFNEVQDPEIEAAMEKLASDTTFQKEAIASAMILSSRIYEMDSLTQQTIEATKDVKELEELNKSMQNLYVRTQNARKAYDEYLAETVKVIEGEKSESYEQASNNAILAFTLLEGNVSSFPKYIDSFSDYLRDNKNEAIDEVAVKWVEFCAEDAVLNQNQASIDAWKQTYSDAQNKKVNIGKLKKLNEFPTHSGIIVKLGKAVDTKIFNKMDLTGSPHLQNFIRNQDQLSKVIVVIAIAEPLNSIVHTLSSRQTQTTTMLNVTPVNNVSKW